MKIRTIKNSFALTAVAMVLTACGSSSSDEHGEPVIGAAIGVSTDVEQTASAADTNYIAITDEELGVFAEVPDTDTNYIAITDEELGVLAEVPDTDTNYIAITDEELGVLAEVPDTDTSRLQVFNDFTFDTARQTRVYMSVPEAIGVSAEATFCTDYRLQNNGDYDVNYDSCVLTTPMFGGLVDEELSLVNQHDSVLGIVWFQDTDMAPQYQEFQFD